jgi:hypothetical protein
MKNLFSFAEAGGEEFKKVGARMGPKWGEDN